MNRLLTFTLMPIIAGAMVVFLGLVRIVSEPPHGWQLWLVIPAVVAAVLFVAALLNLSIFGPIYWVLGRRKSKNQPDQDPRTVRHE